MRLIFLGTGLLISALAAFGCSDSTSPGGGTAGAGGGGSNGGAGAGAASTFKSVKPCDMESLYVTGKTMVTAPDTDIVYTPSCLKVAKGTSVTIQASAAHPLSGTMESGASASNPIAKNATTPQTVAFPTAGIYTFACDVHGGLGMKGAVWVTE